MIEKNKKIGMTFLLMVLLLGNNDALAQSSVGDWVTTPIASPSMASMAKFSDAPVSIQTGQPSIQIPLLEFPGNTGNFNYPLGLSYNSMSDYGSDVSDVGDGWSFAAGGVVYKKVMGDLADESYHDASASYYTKNEFDDIYYYNLPGYSGKFIIKRNTSNDTFSLVKMTMDNMKITYERDNSVSATLKIKNFTLTDDQGYQYFFNTVNVNRYKFPDEFLGVEYNSAYMLTEIKNASGISLVNFTYDKKDKYSGNIRLYENYRLKSIQSKKGQVIFSQTYDEALEKSVNDPYSLQGMTIKNPAGETVYSYVFGSSVNGSRTLNYIEKKDKNATKIERTDFVYSSSKLEKIIFPQGAVTQYEYEQGELFFNYNDSAYLASIESSLTFNPEIQYEQAIMTNQVNTSTAASQDFTIPGDASKKKRFVFKLNIAKNYSGNDLPSLPGTPKPPKNLKFILKKGSEQIFVFTNYNNESKELLIYPGVYTLQAVYDPYVSGVGTYTVIETKFRPQPYRNALKAGRRRLKSIKYYAGTGDTVPKKTIHYEYDAFDMSNSSSGYGFVNEEGASNSYTLYRNVKVSETGLGYTKYTFGNPDDFPKQQVGGTASDPVYFWPYYNVTKQGLMMKKEIYDVQNTLLNSEFYTYEPDHYFDEEYIFSSSSNIKSKTAYLKKTGSVSKAYYAGGGILQAASETHISNSNLQPYYIKNTADGEVSERFLTYAAGLPDYAHLVAANMTGIPVITEEKKNGKTISRTITEYKNLSLLPTSVLAANLADGSLKKAVKMDAYDSGNNPVQISSDAGQPVVFIYGYNGTQVIAKIEGAQFAAVKDSPLVTAAVQASDADNLNSAAEGSLIAALDNLRKDASMTGYRITAYTYDPLVGVTTMTSPNGLRELYEYDAAGRLKIMKREEKDASGNTVISKIKEYQYNYKN
ncbi:MULTISPECIES: hypothetical protein [Chryseobacterium]|uniref:YD repeat-containing protein n=1 Tax=Chryseobacterium camelliae TaxID=1265445 RepID=A0ABU0TNE9_9FLAO|nr:MULTISPECIES: hypothetical protein [Chryseobacterium]MDT3407569.1 hypothetical protein [Pseudacidovorax intermedius]MDQ1098578.1 hypothetical protein [Chryseobacterium camelliae]MDQ1102502.1 hypothetical protein [Chryseobacterium sp. SORGH_AS_1048]MDR6085936.1 hypothetical protein [Chryseobacterium sp. SORGH_AS_0909]MDR6130302.1 hypothetical protein [Chryseobacterium sp. SORGH_AS_1175]